MKVPKSIPILNMPPEIFKLVKEKKDEMVKKGNFQCGYGRATILVIKDLMNGNGK